jgi:predicted nucleotidyltransferase
MIYEVDKFCKLLAKGNPKVIEPLFAEHLCFCSQEWETLKTLKSLAITQTTVTQYVGYALGKISDYKKGTGQDANKNFYHAIRLLKEAKRMVEGENPQVWFTGEDREYLMSIRRGEHSGKIIHSFLCFLTAVII